MKNPELSSWLTVPFIHWLGLFPSDIIDTRFKIPLNKADEKILDRQKKMAALTHGTRFEAWIDILEEIEQLGFKFELESIDAQTSLVDFIRHKIENRNFL